MSKLDEVLGLNGDSGPAVSLETKEDIKELFKEVIGKNHKLTKDSPLWYKNENDLKEHLRRKVGEL